MSPRDKLGKAAWMVTVASTDAVEQTLSQVLAQNNVKLERSHIDFLRPLLKASVEAGYQRAYGQLMREVDSAIEMVTDAIVQSVPPAPPAKKNSRPGGGKRSGTS